MNDKRAYANRALNGRLFHELRRRRLRGDTLDEIAYYLHGHGVTVSRETIRAWAEQASTEQAS